MAATAENKRLVTIDCLLTGRQAAARFRIVDVDGHVHIDSAKRINNRFESIEVDFRIMGNGHAREFRNCFHSKRRTAERIGSVNLIDAITVDVDQRVALDRNERHLLLLRVDARKHHGVAAI